MTTTQPGRMAYEAISSGSRRSTMTSRSRARHRLERGRAGSTGDRGEPVRLVAGDAEHPPAAAPPVRPAQRAVERPDPPREDEPAGEDDGPQADEHCDERGDDGERQQDLPHRRPPPSARRRPGGESCGVRDDGHAVVLDRHEAAVEGGYDVLAGGGRDPDLAAREQGQQGLVAAEDADVAVDGPRDDAAGLARPHLAVGGDQRDLQWHVLPPLTGPCGPTDDVLPLQRAEEDGDRDQECRIPVGCTPWPPRMGAGSCRMTMPEHPW